MKPNDQNISKSKGTKSPQCLDMFSGKSRVQKVQENKKDERKSKKLDRQSTFPSNKGFRKVWGSTGLTPTVTAVMGKTRVHYCSIPVDSGMITASHVTGLQHKRHHTIVFKIRKKTVFFHL